VEFIILAVDLLVVFLMGFFFFYARFYRKVDQAYAMIVNTTRSEPDVTFSRRLVIPTIHNAEKLNMTRKIVEVDCR